MENYLKIYAMGEFFLRDNLTSTCFYFDSRNAAPGADERRALVYILFHSRVHSLFVRQSRQLGEDRSRVISRDSVERTN